MERVWFITGTSTGFGHELVEQLLEQKQPVVATARRTERLPDAWRQNPNCLISRLDVTDHASIVASVSQAISRFGRIDVLVNNAGYGVVGAIEEVDLRDARAQFETNFFGVLAVQKEILPYMRESRSGHIVQISSIGGIKSYPGTGIYCASKFALEAMSESLAQEVKHLGIRVSLIEPGAFRTAFNGANVTGPAEQIDDYKDTLSETMDWFLNTQTAQPGDPKKAVAAIIQAVENQDSPFRILLGRDAWDAAHVKLNQLASDFETGKSTALSTEFDANQ